MGTEKSCQDLNIQKSDRRGDRLLKKIKAVLDKMTSKFYKNTVNSTGKVRLMKQDEAGFGRINKPKYCWSLKGIRPDVPYHHVREYLQTFIPPYTPEMNPIKQIWKEIRKMGFHNRCFSSLEKMVEKLCETISLLSLELVKSVTLRMWVYCLF